MKRSKEYFRGCLLGGAIGDAFGAPVKTMKYNKIVKTYGEKGLHEFVIEEGSKKATITDDTQLTLFTAEGLIRSEVRAHQKGKNLSNKDRSTVIFRAYLRWLYTQGLRTPNWNEQSYDGWLVKHKGLHGYREPGVTCITALGKGVMGTPSRPINQSRRCETVIRVAPIGLFESVDNAFEMGKLVGAITHGTPEAYMASGAGAMMISCIIAGETIEDAVKSILNKLKNEEAQTCVEDIERAITLAKQNNPSQEHLHQLGDGFMASQALAMAIYCALLYPEDLFSGLALAINQDGNSNSVASIYGNIVGAYIGEHNLPQQCLEGIELRKEITQIADDLWIRYEEETDFQERYPGW